MNKGKCSCRLFHTGLDDIDIDYCPLHEAALKMYEALKLYISHQEGKRGHYCSVCHNEIEKAIAKVEGGKR